MTTREFRTAESYKAEHVTREMLKPFLVDRGFLHVQDNRKRIGTSESQTIHATDTNGELLAMRVKLCWRRRRNNDTYSAVQLLAKIKGNDWEGSLQRFVDGAEREGVSHFLFIQREGSEITAAALVPLSDLLTIWCDQRRLSESLLAEGRLGRRKKNHATNGSSPTLWLHDDLAPSVTAALWKHSGVRNLVDEPIGETEQAVDDTFDDLPGIDYSLLGSDGASRTNTVRSHVKRDQRVRAVVLGRAKGQCEQEECGTGRNYPGFLDVHHILGAETSDRVWNCVALCPNCHREAHFAPNRELINASLLDLAMRFKESRQSTTVG